MGDSIRRLAMALNNYVRFKAIGECYTECFRCGRIGFGDDKCLQCQFDHPSEDDKEK